MGGHAFPNLNIKRINRNQIINTLEHIIQSINYPFFDKKYVLDNLMGSALKQESSGDLDIALNNQNYFLIGQPNIPVFDFKLFTQRCREILPTNQINTKSYKSGQINTAWEIIGGNKKDLIQVDFISGNSEWLLFSHWSPGLDISPYKGVLISTMLGVLSKIHKEYELFDNNRRIARIGLKYNLEKGLYRCWELSKNKNEGLSVIDPDLFETKIPTAPRLSRIGYITHPETVLNYLFDNQNIKPKDIDTFEKIIKIVKNLYPIKYNEIKERFIVAALKSSANFSLSRKDLVIICDENKSVL